MNKRIISKVGKRQRPEIDMMEYMQTQETIEFDLDRDLFTDKPLRQIKKNTVIPVAVAPDIEQNAEFSVEIENNEV